MPLEENLEEQKRQEMGKNLMKSVVSNTMLMIGVIIYVVGGAYLFIDIEFDGVQEGLDSAKKRSEEIEHERAQLAEDLWDYKQQPDYDQVVEKLIEEYHTNLTDAIDSSGGMYPGRPLTDEDDAMTNRWMMSSSILFTMTVITTVGYGHISPATPEGQAFLIAYAILGFPLMFLFLANIGGAMARFFRTAYSRGCCRCCNNRRNRELEHQRREAELAKLGKGGRKHTVADGKHGNRPKSGWSQDYKEEGDDIADFSDEKKEQTTTVEEIVSDDIDIDSVNVPISLVLCVIAAYILVGALLFTAFNEGWSMILGAYYCFVTLTTIGFGDYFGLESYSEMSTTKGAVKMGFASIYIVLGLAVLSMAFNLMMEEMLQKFKWIGKKLGVVDDDEADAVVGKTADEVPTGDSADLVQNEVNDAVV